MINITVSIQEDAEGIARWQVSFSKKDESSAAEIKALENMGLHMHPNPVSDAARYLIGLPPEKR